MKQKPDSPEFLEVLNSTNAIQKWEFRDVLVDNETKVDIPKIIEVTKDNLKPQTEEWILWSAIRIGLVELKRRNNKLWIEGFKSEPYEIVKNKLVNFDVKRSMTRLDPRPMNLGELEKIHNSNSSHEYELHQVPIDIETRRDISMIIKTTKSYAEPQTERWILWAAIKVGIVEMKRRNKKLWKDGKKQEPHILLTNTPSNYEFNQELRRMKRQVK